jgi:hypothetical protein
LGEVSLLLVSFAIFADMKKSTKQIFSLFFALCLTIILADGSFIDHAFVYQYSGFHQECSDVSNHLENSCSVCFEDDIFINHSKIKSNIFLSIIEPLAGLMIIFENDNFTSIWQPPKFS